MQITYTSVRNRAVAIPTALKTNFCEQLCVRRNL